MRVPPAAHLPHAVLLSIPTSHYLAKSASLMQATPYTMALPLVHILPFPEQYP